MSAAPTLAAARDLLRRLDRTDRTTAFAHEGVQDAWWAADDAGREAIDAALATLFRDGDAHEGDLAVGMWRTTDPPPHVVPALVDRWLATRDTYLGYLIGTNPRVAFAPAELSRLQAAYGADPGACAVLRPALVRADPTGPAFEALAADTRAARNATELTPLHEIALISGTYRRWLAVVATLAPAVKGPFGANLPEADRAALA